MKRAKHFIAVFVLIIIGTLVMRWVLSWLFQVPVAASAEAIPIDIMSNVHFWVIAFLFSLIMILMLYSVFVFRRKPGDEEDAPHGHGNTALEIGWTIVPTIVVIGFGIWGSAVLLELTRPEPGEMPVDVYARQWSWSFEYPESGDFRTAEIVLPVNQPIVLNMRSEDVLHDFWVIEFRVKQDVVPGRVEQLRITPTLEGEYKVRCAEICGNQHANMIAPLRVVSQDEFDTWIEEKLAQPKYADLTPEERGALWASAEGFGCVACHSSDGTPGVGPTWQGLMGSEEIMTDGTAILVHEEYIRASIMDPNAQMVEGFLPNLMPQDYADRFAAREAEILASEGIEIDIVADIIAYIDSLQE